VNNFFGHIYYQILTHVMRNAPTIPALRYVCFVCCVLIRPAQSVNLQCCVYRATYCIASRHTFIWAGRGEFYAWQRFFLHLDMRKEMCYWSKSTKQSTKLSDKIRTNFGNECRFLETQTENLEVKMYNLELSCWKTT
jgi:hypothetical protein